MKALKISLSYWSVYIFSQNYYYTSEISKIRLVF